MTLNRFTSWSFSRLGDYEACPAKARYKHLDKLPEPKSPALERGGRIHQLAEAYLTRQLKSLPPELQAFAGEFKALRARGDLLVEESWAFTKAWEPCRWDDWDRCWLRAKADCCYFLKEQLVIIDWKTGKFRPEQAQDYLRQLELYALLGLLRYPKVQRVVPHLVYLDQGLLYPEQDLVYERAAVEALKAEWERRVQPLFADVKFEPRPGWACRWCAFSQAKGGPCQF